MGCTPSIHVSHTGIIYCREVTTEDSPPCSSNHLLYAGGRSESGTMTHLQRNAPSNSISGHSYSQGCLSLGPMQLDPNSLKVLLVFGKTDGVYDAWHSACLRERYEVSNVTSSDKLLNLCVERLFDLIVVDGRSSKHFNAVNLCKSLKTSENSSLSAMVAVVKKNALEKDPSMVTNLLCSGFSRVVPESSNSLVVLNEIVQITRCEIAMHRQKRAAAALFAALDACKDIIHITDTKHKIQYVNRSCETHLGYTLEELLGKTLWEVHGSDHHRQDNKLSPQDPKGPFSADPQHRSSLDGVSFQKRPSIENRTSDAKQLNLDISEAVNLQMRRGKDWEGLVTCRRKSGDIVQLNSKVSPIAPQIRKNEYYVYWSDSSSMHPDRMEISHHAARGSVKSHRKPSYDIRSLNSDGSIMRRQSLAKLHSVMVEAPITRVVNIISAAQENSPAYVAQALDKVLEILRSTELYNPQLLSDSHNKPVSAADPVATDLLGALLSHGPKPLSGRRSSNDQSNKSSTGQRHSLPALQPTSNSILEIMAEPLCWNFDVIKLESLSENRPLVWLGMNLMCRFNVPNTLGCDEQTLQNWLTLVEANYHSSNTYHNSTHAADVLHSIAYFIENTKIKTLMNDPLETAACLIAAVVHDVDHPGKNSQFLCNTNNELAILYNDVCVLESHHTAVSFKLTTSDNRVNILKGLDLDSYKVVRKNIIDMVLATDMAKHFEHVNRFINMLDKCTVKLEEDNRITTQEDEPQSIDLSLVRNSSENLEIVRRMMIKCADVNNPLKAQHLCIDWAQRIANEYFNQTEEEKRRAIPVVMPQFDRTTCSIPKSQIGFIDFFIFDMFEALHELASIPELIDQLNTNYQYWKKQEEIDKIEKVKTPSVKGTTEDEPSDRTSPSKALSSPLKEDIIFEEVT